MVLLWKGREFHQVGGYYGLIKKVYRIYGFKVESADLNQLLKKLYLTIKK